ncbi:MAG: hypothetical protein LBF40_00845 [Deltaproteobacteria bacterium]|jgi:hypothetical protein|nr:hypothetical protein [Deltaproteobacteria bacterium]
MIGLHQARCPNADCKDFGKENTGNIAIRGRYGKNKDKLLLYCRTCGKRFASTHGTPMFASHLPIATIHSIIHHVSMGESLRSTSRLVGIPKATVKLTMDKLEAFCLKSLREITDTLELDVAHIEKLWVFLRRLQDMRRENRKVDLIQAPVGIVPHPEDVVSEVEASFPGMEVSIPESDEDA